MKMKIMCNGNSCVVNSRNKYISFREPPVLYPDPSREFILRKKEIKIGSMIKSKWDKT